MTKTTVMKTEEGSWRHARSGREAVAITTACVVSGDAGVKEEVKDCVGKLLQMAGVGCQGREEAGGSGSTGLAEW